MIEHEYFSCCVPVSEPFQDVLPQLWLLPLYMAQVQARSCAPWRCSVHQRTGRNWGNLLMLACACVVANYPHRMLSSWRVCPMRDGCPLANRGYTERSEQLFSFLIPRNPCVGTKYASMAS